MTTTQQSPATPASTEQTMQPGQPQGFQAIPTRIRDARDGQVPPLVVAPTDDAAKAAICESLSELSTRLAEIHRTSAEAYLSQADDASHSARGETARCASMFLEAGHAYPCFCTRERLDELRAAQRASKSQEQGYDGLCKEIAGADAAARIAAGEDHVVRLDVPATGKTSWVDLMNGGGSGAEVIPGDGPGSNLICRHNVKLVAPL